MSIRCNLLTKHTEQGLMAFVATIGLPALLFSSICQLKIAALKWEVIAAIIGAKLVLIGLGAAFSWAATRSTDRTGFAYTLGGTTALMATMSDDMGIGLPIFLSFMKDTEDQERYGRVLHLIVLSALQSGVVNPIAFVMLGLGRARSDEQKEAARRLSLNLSSSTTIQPLSFGKVLVDVVMGFRRNMLVMAVVAGATYNVLTDAAPLPWWLFIPVDVAGQAFRPLVLVIGGMALSSSVGHLTSLRLAVLPTILVVLKSIILPSLALYLLLLLSPPSDGVGGDHGAGYVDFVFFYGVLPVATSTLAIVQSYRVEDELVASLASSLVLGKFVAFTLLLLAAYVITFGKDLLMSSISQLSLIMHSLSVLGCTYVLMCAYIDPRHRVRERRSLLVIAALQASYSCVFLLARVLALTSPEARQELPQPIFQMLFSAVSLFRWACHGWILAMIYDQYRRVLTAKIPSHLPSPSVSRSPRGSTWRMSGAPRGRSSKADDRRPFNERRRPSLDEYFLADSSEAALGGTPLYVHALCAAAFAVAMTAPFVLDVTHVDDLIQSIQRHCKGNQPVDAALWAPYARQTAQDEVYITAYVGSAALLVVFLSYVLQAARDTPSLEEQGSRTVDDEQSSTSDEDFSASAAILTVGGAQVGHVSGHSGGNGSGSGGGGNGGGRRCSDPAAGWSAAAPGHPERGTLPAQPAFSRRSTDPSAAMPPPLAVAPAVNCACSLRSSTRSSTTSGDDEIGSRNLSPEEWRANEPASAARVPPRLPRRSPHKPPRPPSVDAGEDPTGGGDGGCGDGGYPLTLKEERAPRPSLIAASDSFVKPRGVVTLHVRIQLLGVLLLLRCVCEASTLFNLFLSSGSWEGLCWKDWDNTTGLPHVAAAPYAGMDGLSPPGETDDHHPARALASAHPDVRASRVSTSLLFYVFVFFEDGQGFLTFLLFGLQSPTRVMPSLLPAAFLRRRTRASQERPTSGSPAVTGAPSSTAGSASDDESVRLRRRMHIPRTDSKEAVQSPAMLRNLRHLGVPPRPKPSFLSSTASGNSISGLAGGSGGGAAGNETPAISPDESKGALSLL